MALGKGRGNWGSAEGVEPNSHGNFKPLLKAIREMALLAAGKIPAPNKLVVSANPDWFNGNLLSEEGKRVLQQVISLIPSAVSKDGIQYLEENGYRTRNSPPRTGDRQPTIHTDTVPEQTLGGSDTEDSLSGRTGEPDTSCTDA